MRNVEWMRNRVARLVKYDTTLADQDFRNGTNDAWGHIDAALSEAYNKWVERAIQEGKPEWFLAEYPLTWASEDQDLVLPPELVGLELLRMDDVTAGYPGFPLWILDNDPGNLVYFATRNTLRWGTAGPGADLTLNVTYMQSAEYLNEPSLEATLVPDRFRDGLVWEAACILRSDVDEGSPQEWRKRANDALEDYIMFLSRGRIQRPVGVGSRAARSQNDNDDF